MGKIVGFHHSEKGFAFISTGAGTAEYFVHRSDVPPDAWFDGSLLEFTPAPPKPPGKNMRAEHIIPRQGEEE